MGRTFSCGTNASSRSSYTLCTRCCICIIIRLMYSLYRNYCNYANVLCVCIGIDIIEVKHLCNCIYSSKVSASMCARTIFAFAASLHKYRSTTVLIIIIITITYFMRGEDSSGQRGYISTFTPVPLHKNNRIRARRPQIKKWFRAGKRACPESCRTLNRVTPTSVYNLNGHDRISVALLFRTNNAN